MDRISLQSGVAIAMLGCMLLVPVPALACGECEYEFCTIGCVCLPKSGCILRIIPPQIRPPDPGRLTERLKTDPIGAIVNPIGVYNPTGIPQTGDIVEFAIKNPDQLVRMAQDPRLVAYTPVAAAIISGRNAVIAKGGHPIPAKIKAFLSRWYSQELINSVRWTEDWGALSNTFQAAQMQFNDQTNAITLMNAVVFRETDAASDPALWAHEMYHVQQYRDWGVMEFARRWVNNSSEGGPVEAPAYARQEEAANVEDTTAFVPNPVQKLPSGYILSPCACWGAVAASAVAPSAVCASGAEVPRACGPMGPCSGGAPWVRVCQ